MKGLRFSLLQLVVSIGLILIIAYFVMQIGARRQENTQDPPPIEPQITTTYQEIKINQP